MLEPITWTGNVVRLLDQTKLPGETVYLDIVDEKQMHDAIRRLVVRGAPAIGIAAGFGAYLGVRDCDDSMLPAKLKNVCDYLATSRPTAVNLFWALDHVQSIGTSKQRILDECLRMKAENDQFCRAMGENGLRELREKVGRRAGPIRLLTHCNAGLLAGTGALSPIYVGIEQGVAFEVFADETRPLLQGSRLTAYELSEAGVPVTVICDNMAASVLAKGTVDAVIVGADRIAANGDTANKIGTLSVAIAARHFGVPFYVAAPTNTIDLRTPTGDGIPIEERSHDEVTTLGARNVAPANASVFNPAFDVTPAALIEAIITERGVIRPVSAGTIAALLGA